MTWFLFALVCMLGWGCADLFYKKGTDDSDRYSHLKIAVWVGMVMGACSLLLLFLPVGEKNWGSIGEFLRDTVRYLPASSSYILSMVIGYAGLRYLEVSIVSPVQNASGALSAMCMAVYFTVFGKFESITDEFSVLDFIGTALIVVSVIALAVVEQRLEDKERKTVDAEADKKYRYGALALLFPILYCVFDTVGTAADGIILDGEAGMGLDEISVLILYGLTFLAAGLAAWVILWVKEKKPYRPFAKTERSKGIAAVCEEFGQIFYVYAMAENPVLAAPLVASYCIVSMLLSRVFLREKLTKAQYFCIFAVVAGIVLLGISEGLAEL